MSWFVEDPTPIWIVGGLAQLVLFVVSWRTGHTNHGFHGTVVKPRPLVAPASLTHRRQSLKIEHPIGRLSHIVTDVLSAREVVDRVQTLKDDAQHNDRPINRGNQDSVELIHSVQRSKGGTKFGLGL